MHSNQTISVSDLLGQAHAGDAVALNRLFTECRNYLDIVAQTQVETWLKAKFDPSDLVQQTLMDAYRGFGDFRGGTTAEWLAWLKRILERNAVDLARHYAGTDKRQAQREIRWQGGNGDSSTDGRIDAKDLAESPSQQLLRKERELLVADALMQLAPDHREVILLRNLERLPFDAVAQRMNRSRPAVQMLWMRALEKLREALARLESLFLE
jgi:RNA polymerase sigma-70 factor (ECF subfamily)